MSILPWFINPRHSLGDVSKYAIPFSFRHSLSRLVVYTLRKYPSLKAFAPSTKLGAWPAPPCDTPSVSLDLDQYDSCVTYLGHRTLYLKIGGATFLTDPVFSRRLLSGGFGVKRVDNAFYKYWEMPRADFLLVSNNSFDCLDWWTLMRISIFGSATAIGGKNLSKYLTLNFKRQTYTLKWFESVDFGSVRVTFVPSCSQTRRKWLGCGIDLNLLLWGGFIISDKNTNIYYAGRTAYSSHFKEIRGFLGDAVLDLAILPIGPSFKYSRDMGPEEAVKAHLDLKAKRSLLVAHDTFPLGIEAFGEMKSRILDEIKRLDPEGSKGLKQQLVFINHRQTVEI